MKIAPFHLLATEGAVHDDKTHEWHMQTLGRLTAAGGILSATEHLTVAVEDQEAVGAATLWWTEHTGRGAEGMVVKPETFVAHTERGIAAPAIKCRGREYLRIIYGPEYTTPTQLEQLRKRSTRGKMALATREFALGMHALHQFVERAPLRNVAPGSVRGARTRERADRPAALAMEGPAGRAGPTHPTRPAGGSLTRPRIDTSKRGADIDERRQAAGLQRVALFVRGGSSHPAFGQEHAREFRA